MALVLFLDLVILSELVTTIYNYSNLKSSVFDTENGDKSKKLSLTNIVIMSLILSLINTLYFIETINPKWTVLNLLLLSIVSSVFIYISYNYLLLESKSPPGYQASQDALLANTENVNKDIRETNSIVATTTISITGIILAFYVGYKFFSRVEIKELDKPFIVFKRKIKTPKIKLKI